MAMDLDLKKLEDALAKYEITIAEANDLVVLQGYKVVVIADDSTSMNMTDDKNVKTERRQCITCNGTGQVNRMPCESCRGKKFAHYVVGSASSRWDELRETFDSLIDIIAGIIPGGSDVYFLNGPVIKGVQSAKDRRIVQQFAAGPHGNTPLTSTVQKLVLENQNEELPVLVIILTDGEPDGGAAAFRQVVASIANKQMTQVTYKFQIMACTDDDSAVSWLNEFDAQFAAVDVTDDYKSEKAEVLKAGKASRFRRSDWVIKALLGPISSKFDGWDEADVRSAQCGMCGEGCSIM